MTSLDKKTEVDRVDSDEKTTTPLPTPTPTLDSEQKPKESSICYLRHKDQDIKDIGATKYNDESVTIYAPNWVQPLLNELSNDLDGQNFSVRTPHDSKSNDNTKVAFQIKKNSLTLQLLQKIARNEQFNCDGVINFENYKLDGKFTKETVYALKDLARQCIIIGKDSATHHGGYPRDSQNKRIEHKKAQPVYICDLAGLQFQQLYNSGRLVLIGDDLAKLPKGTLDDEIFSKVVGETKKSYLDCEKDHSGRYKKVKMDCPSYSSSYTSSPQEFYFDTQAYKRFIAKDVALCGLALNQQAGDNKDDVNFKFLKYGTGHFADSLTMPPDCELEDLLAEGVYEGLQELFANNQSFSQIKCIELPFYDHSGASQRMKGALKNIEKLCEKHHLEFRLGSDDALKQTTKYITATTNCADPHAVTGNEMKHGSVDASIAENLKSKGNIFSPFLNTKMKSVFANMEDLLLIIEEQIKSTVKRLNTTNDLGFWQRLRPVTKAAIIASVGVGVTAGIATGLSVLITGNAATYASTVIPKFLALTAGQVAFILGAVLFLIALVCTIYDVGIKKCCNPQSSPEKMPAKA